MESIPLAEGDLGWVFPELADEREVRGILRRAAWCIEQLADHLGTRPSWTGVGLEFHRDPDQHSADLFGCAETADVSFVAELTLPRDPVEWVPLARPPWSVEGHVSVRCDARVDCGMHVIETRPVAEHADPIDAAGNLLAVATWLLQRGTEEPARSWRQRDSLSAHP